MSTQDFLTLKEIAEQSIKILADFQLLAEQNKKLQQEKLKLSSEYEFLSQKFQYLQDTSKLYNQIPPYWRKNIDKSIDSWKKTVTSYWHDLHRATVRVFIANHGNLNKTVAIMKPIFDNFPIAYPKKYIQKIIESAIRQFKSHSKPSDYPPSWKPPKPKDTDYSKPDELGIIPLQLSKVPDVDWNLINWDLLSQLDKDEIRHKQILHSL